MRITAEQTCMCPRPLYRKTCLGFRVCLCGSFIVPGAYERERQRISAVRASLIEKRADRIRAEEAARAKMAEVYNDEISRVVFP